MMSRVSAVLFLLLLAPDVLWAQPDAGTPDADAGAEEVIITQGDQTGERIRSALSRVEPLSDTSVSFGAGVATLEGMVPTTKDREVAEKIASKVDGVLWVDNRLAVSDAAPVEDASTTDEAIRERLARVFAKRGDRAGSPRV